MLSFGFSSFYSRRKCLLCLAVSVHCSSQGSCSATGSTAVRCVRMESQWWEAVSGSLNSRSIPFDGGPFLCFSGSDIGMCRTELAKWRSLGSPQLLRWELGGSRLAAVSSWLGPQRLVLLLKARVGPRPQTWGESNVLRGEVDSGVSCWALTPGVCSSTPVADPSLL